jgi:hypothetical protein
MADRKVETLPKRRKSHIYGGVCDKSRECFEISVGKYLFTV